ncbi:unnamed protein product [Macrosiphum euphorbiae]|uniref:Uncharacterized protein n=1 Tax=Macrosiphum euphorbiae TaxID=13131 RepID=A0AAV0XYI2_9HEMI|nr:unnamed protein product [Macrosiphum euphorbiae]CAI6373739.1 unnamed protein product [Macrosiphum euphorbiae]
MCLPNCVCIDYKDDTIHI